MQLNPVIEKELKTKMRGWKSPALLTVYLGFLGLFILLYFLTNNQLTSYNLNNFNPRVALNSYNTLATLQFMLILFITPAMTAGAISGERERQTLDLMLCTNLSSFSIVIGKILVSIAHVLLLITASLPILGMVFLFGGIGIVDLLLLFGFYLTTALMLGSMGIFYSSIFRKSSVSMVVSYISVFALLGGTFIALVLWMIVTKGILDNPPSVAEIIVFFSPNPLFGFASISGISSGSRLSIISEIFAQLNQYVNPSGVPKWYTKPWVLNTCFNLIASAIFIFISSWKIKPVKKGLFRK
jgi:ABC-type Na+ efflux pump, permease component